MRVFYCILFSRPPRESHRPRPAGRLHRQVLTAITCACFATTTYAETVRAYESPLELEAAQKKLEALLGDLDRGRFYYEKETGGYAWRAENRWSSPFDYRIYGGVVSARKPVTIIRIEGDDGDALAFAQILNQEKFFLPEAIPEDPEGSQPLDDKYHLIAQPLNLLAPWLAVLYESYDSPRLTTGQTWWRFLTYFFFDALFIYAGGTNWFQQGKFEPQKYASNIAGGLALMRVIGSWQSLNLVQGHNRMAELKYTFPISD